MHNTPKLRRSIQKIPEQNETEIFFRKLSKISYIFGAPDYWQDDNYQSTVGDKIHDHLTKFIDFLLCIFIVFEWGAYFTQTNLNDKQRNNLYLFCFGHPCMQAFGLSFHYHQDKVKQVIRKVATLNRVYYNLEVEKAMIKRSKIFLIFVGGLFFTVLLSYAVDGYLQSVSKGISFITVVTAWPDVEDSRFIAGFGRLMAYLLWVILNFRFFAVLILVISLTICLSHHFRNLSVYFHSLNDIFDEEITQKEKDEKYEKAFLIGVKLHVDILEYKKRCEEVSRVVYGGEILLNISSVIALLLQMAESERTLLTTISTLSAVMCVNITTGCFMWNAGDITIEASVKFFQRPCLLLCVWSFDSMNSWYVSQAAHLSTALFESGWQRCSRDGVVRMKPMLVFCLMMSQKPVLLKCLGVVKLSYESYLTIVKTSYSVFSVLY